MECLVAVLKVQYGMEAYQTGQVVPGFALQFRRVPEPVYEPIQMEQNSSVPHNLNNNTLLTRHLRANDLDLLSIRRKSKSEQMCLRLPLS